MIKDKNIVFAKKEPSLFVLQSPFQIFCAVCAIRYFEIDEYKIILVLPHNEVRNNQSVSMLERFNLHYTTIHGSRVCNRRRLSLLMNLKTKYHRAFLGFFAFEDGYYHCLQYLKRNGSLVLLDDGNATIGLLRFDFKPQGRKKYVYRYYYWLLRLRGISFRNVFTVYDGIKNDKWNIEINDLSQIRQGENSNTSNTVYFVGTNSLSYCNGWQLEKGRLERMLEYILKMLKESYPDHFIIYIPHGRDTATYPKVLCDKYGIKFQKLSTIIESFLLDQHSAPKAIYGFTSSALFNIRKMYPETRVYNIIPEDINTKSYLETINYYESQNIQTIIYKE